MCLTGEGDPMKTTTRVGTAIAAGYLFGRFKKLRLAMMVGTALASDNVRKSAVGLVQNGVGGMTADGAGKLAGTAGSKMLDAGRGAVVSAAATRLERISDRLAERTEALDGQSPSRADEDTEPDDVEDEYDEDEYDESEEPEQADESEDDDEPEDEDDDEDVSDEYDDQDDEYDDQDDEYDDQADQDDEDSTPARRTRARRSRALAPASAGSR
jgi:hypothetical protein